MSLFCLGPYIFDSMSGNAYKYNFDKAALADLFARYVAQLRSCVNIYRAMNITENPRLSPLNIRAEVLASQSWW